MSNYGSGMGMIFTNSGKPTSRNIQAPIQAPVQAPQPQIRAFPPAMNAGNRGFRTMDLGNLKTSKSCGSCGH